MSRFVFGLSLSLVRSFGLYGRRDVGDVSKRCGTTSQRSSRGDLGHGGSDMDGTSRPLPTDGECRSGKQFLVPDPTHREDGLAGGSHDGDGDVSRLGSLFLCPGFGVPMVGMGRLWNIGLHLVGDGCFQRPCSRSAP